MHDDEPRWPPYWWIPIGVALVVIVLGWARPKPPSPPVERDPAKLPPELRRVWERERAKGSPLSDVSKAADRGRFVK